MNEIENAFLSFINQQIEEKKELPVSFSCPTCNREIDLTWAVFEGAPESDIDDGAIASLICKYCDWALEFDGMEVPAGWLEKIKRDSSALP